MIGDLTQILDLPLTPDGKLDLATFNTIFRGVQEKFYALEGRTQASQIRNDLSVLGSVAATGGLTGTTLTLGGTTMLPADLSLVPTLDPLLAPSDLVDTNAVGAVIPATSASPFTTGAKDEFLGTGTTTGIIGDLGWALVNGTVAAGTPVAGHFGVSTLTNTAGALARLTLRASLTSEIGYIAGVVQAGADTAGSTMKFGVFSGNLNAGLLGIYWLFDPAVSPNWECVTADATGNTTNITTFPVTASAWYLLEVVITANAAAQRADFYLNRQRGFTHTTNITSTVSATPAVYLTNAASDVVGVDRVVLAGRAPLSAAMWS